MREVAQGKSIDLMVQFRLSSGELVDPDTPHADILDATGALYTEVNVPVRIDVGTYTYTLVVPDNAAVGEWTIVWYGTVSGNTASQTETFNVVTPSQATTTDAIVLRLRRLIGERIPIGKTEDDTRFTDQEIADIYFVNNGDLNKALSELWLSKAAYLQDFVDVQESGTIRHLSQMSRAAMTQATKYEARVQAEDAGWAASYRTLPRTFSPYSQFTSNSRLMGTLVIFVEPARAW